MTAIERTLREEKWMITNELFERGQPAVVVAFRELYPESWDQFEFEVTGNPGVRFFNPELAEFSAAENWEVLAAERGIEAYSDDLAVPDGLFPPAELFVRQFRQNLRSRGCEFTGGVPAFYHPAARGYEHRTNCVLVVQHDGNDVARAFNPSYGANDVFNMVDELLAAFGMWREMTNCIETLIYKPDMEVTA